MRSFIVLTALLALGSADFDWLDRIKDFFNNQQQQNKHDYVIDYVHNYRFEDHNTDKGYHLLVAISDSNPEKECHLIDVEDSWEDLLNDDEDLRAITDEIYHLINTHTGQETDLTRDQLRDKYGDQDALRECYNHQVFVLTYTPSSDITG